MYKKQNELFKYINIIFRRRYVFISVSLIVMTLMTIYAYRMPKMYRADSTVLIEKSIIDNLVKGIAVKVDINDRVKVMKYALLSRELISKVLENIKHKVLKDKEIKIQKYVNELQTRTKIDINRGDLFIVSIEDNDPAFAQKYINTLVRTYVEENISSKRENTYGASRFLEGQLQIFKSKLDKAENAIIDFRRKQGVYFSTDEAVDLKEIKDFMREIEEIELNINSIEARRERLQTQLASLSPTVDILSNALGVNSLVALEKRLSILRLSYTENYPEVVRLSSELQNLKYQAINENRDVDAQTTMLTSVNPLYQELQQQVFEVEAELSSLGAKKQNLERRVIQRETELRDVPENKKELGILVQERDSYRQIYQELLGRMGQSEVSNQVEIADKADTFRIVDPAIFPKTPISPNMVRMILVAIAAGLGCGLGMVLLLDNFDLKIKDSGHLEALGVEVLAVIPSIASLQKTDAGRRLDYVIYSVSGVYCSGFFGLLFYEYMNHFQR